MVIADRTSGEDGKERPNQPFDTVLPSKSPPVVSALRRATEGTSTADRPPATPWWSGGIPTVPDPRSPVHPQKPGFHITIQKMAISPMRPMGANALACRSCHAIPAPTRPSKPSSERAPRK